METLIHGGICVFAMFALIFIVALNTYGGISNGNAWLLAALLVVIMFYSGDAARRSEEG